MANLKSGCILAYWVCPWLQLYLGYPGKWGYSWDVLRNISVVYPNPYLGYLSGNSLGHPRMVPPQLPPQIPGRTCTRMSRHWFLQNELSHECFLRVCTSVRTTLSYHHFTNLIINDTATHDPPTLNEARRVTLGSLSQSGAATWTAQCRPLGLSLWALNGAAT